MPANRNKQDWDTDSATRVNNTGFLLWHTPQCKVDSSELCHFTDVIFSVQSDRPSRDILAGGAYQVARFDSENQSLLFQVALKGNAIFYDYWIISLFRPASLKFSGEAKEVADALSIGWKAYFLPKGQGFTLDHDTWTSS